MSEHDSFLKMIGIDDEEASVESTNEASIDDEVTENEEASFEPEDSNTWKDWSDSLDEEDNDLDEILEESTSHADTGEEPEENNTSIYSHSEVQSLEEELYHEATVEDKLLGGLENAEASRATDIFAQSYRSDERRTRAVNSGTEDDGESFIEESTSGDEADHSDIELLGSTQIKEQGQSHEIWDTSDEDYESYVNSSTDDDAITNVEEGTTPLGETDQNAATDAGRRTVAFSYTETEEEQQPAQLKLLEGAADAQHYELVTLPMRMGRDPGNEIVLDDANSSRYHAELRDQNGSIFLVDLGSTNGVKVNGAIVTEQELKTHDRIQIGDVIFEFFAVNASPSDDYHQLAAHETSVGHNPEPTTKSFDKRKILRVAAAVFIGLGISLYSLKFLGVFESAGQMATQTILGEAELAINDLRSELVQQTGSRPEDLSADLIYQEYQRRVEGSGFIPEKYRELLLNVPSNVVKAFVMDEALSAVLLENAFDENSLRRALTEEFKKEYAANNYKRALRIMDLLVYGNPNNEEFLRIQDELDAIVNTVPDQGPAEVSEEDREKFARYMKDFQTKIEGFIEKGHLDAAYSLANKVKEGILDLVRDEPAFAPLAESAVAEWRSKADQIQRMIKERDSQKREVNQMVSEGEIALQKIKKFLDRGRVYEASLASQTFLENYPDHPRVLEVEAIQQEIGKAVTLSFDSLKSQIETHIKTENYKLAWDALYRFEDLMPGYPPAQEVKVQLAGITRMRAAQFYNQARVFEYEADDLIAAEQYYKKTLETTDPRGDLARKAERRYAEVRRKGIQ